MESFEGLKHSTWNPLKILGYDYAWADINITTVLNTWLVLLVIFVLIIVLNFFLKKKQSYVYYLITTGIESFMHLIVQTLGTFIYPYFSLVISLFIFILFCNWIILIPLTEEPTKDLNTTLAVGLISFFYKEFEGIRIHGLRNYIREFLQPFAIMFPINIIGHFSKIISISFRLFGNIFGGSVIMELYQHAVEFSIWTQFAGLLSGVNFLIILFFGVFEGLIQAFVFAMLTLTYLTIAIYDEHAGEI